MSHELEEMRVQINILKDKLERQTIVNENHIRNSMKSKASDINRVVGISIFAGVFALFYCSWALYKFGLSNIFVISTVVMLAVCVVLTIAQKLTLGKLDFSHGNLVDTARILGKVKTHYSQWHRIAIPLLVIWFGWLIYEVMAIQGSSPISVGFCCGAAVGGIIGGIIGFRMNRKVVRKAEEILSQIEELQKD